MRRSPIKRVLLIVFVLAFTYQPLLPQELPKDYAKEASATVPALKNFHTVIFKIWHTAWPHKDYDLLIALFPKIDKGVNEVAHAELPGILREKQAAYYRRNIDPKASVISPL